jgi:hypothetical protein
MGKVEQVIEVARKCPTITARQLENIERQGRELEEEYCTQIKPVTGRDDCNGFCDACSEMIAGVNRMITQAQEG